VSPEGSGGTGVVFCGVGLLGLPGPRLSTEDEGELDLEEPPCILV